MRLEYYFLAHLAFLCGDGNNKHLLFCLKAADHCFGSVDIIAAVQHPAPCVVYLNRSHVGNTGTDIDVSAVFIHHYAGSAPRRVAGA